MRRLYVLFDEQCGFCRRVAIWLRSQRQHVPLVTLARQSPTARQHFGAAIDASGDDEMIVIADTGEVYRGTGAYLVCLWALKATRRWSHRLARPALRPLVRGVFATLARNRRTLSAIMGYANDRHVADELQRRQPITCAPVNGGER